MKKRTETAKLNNAILVARVQAEDAMSAMKKTIESANAAKHGCVSMMDCSFSEKDGLSDSVLAEMIERTNETEEMLENAVNLANEAIKILSDAIELASHAHSELMNCHATVRRSA